MKITKKQLWNKFLIDIRMKPNDVFSCYCSGYRRAFKDLKFPIFTLDFIINKTMREECLLCKINLKREFGERDYHIPLCKKHRIEYLDKEAKKLLKHKK